MKKQKVTYTATFSDGTTETKATSAAKGFGFAVKINFAKGTSSVSFSATKAGVMKHIQEWRDMAPEQMIGATILHAEATTA